MDKTRYFLILIGLTIFILLSGCAGEMKISPAGTLEANPTALLKSAEGTPTPNRTPTGKPQIQASQTPVFPLPDTGQAKDYTPVFGEDSDYILHPPVYMDNGNGTVTDQVTGLIWQQRDGGEMIFANAGLYCQKLELGGLSDWRLPDSMELFSILDHDRNPALDPKYFPASGAEYWWTRSEAVGDSNKAWVVNAGGGIGAHPKNETLSAGGSKHFHTRCVLNGTGTLAHQDSDQLNVTIGDLNTGLVWQQSESAEMNWESALKACEALTLGGRDDWRLPNIKELQSLSDETRSRPSIDPTYFPGARNGRYWSSTTLFGKTGSAWFIDFTSGLASYEDKLKLLSVRCVRGG